MKKESPKLLERLDCSWSPASKRLFHTPSAFARRTLFFIQEAGYFETHAPYFTERQNLDSFLLIYTVGGHGLLSYENEQIRLSAHSLCLMDCKNAHRYECPSNTDWDFYWAHFHGIAAQGYYEQAMEHGFYVQNEIKEADILPSFQQMISLLEEKTAGFEVLMSACITQLLTTFLLANYPDVASHEISSHTVSDLARYIEQNYEMPLSLDQLSDEFHLSKYHLSREFKHYTGTSPYEYLLLCRLNHAKELLKYSTLSIDQIAEKCGFNQTSHFISLFKNREKITPLSYRKQWG